MNIELNGVRPEDSVARVASPAACACSFFQSATMRARSEHIYALQLMQINYVTSFKLPKKFADKRMKTTRKLRHRTRAVAGKKKKPTNMNTRTKLTLSQLLAVGYMRPSRDERRRTEIKSQRTFDYKQCDM